MSDQLTKTKHPPKHQKHTPMARFIPKSELAESYGRSWKSINKIIHEILPDLKGCRKRLLSPKQVQMIYEEYGKPKEDNFFKRSDK